MTSDKAKKIKAIVKGTAPKSTFGTNPNDPWSAKYNVAESNDLDRYLKSRGINPAFVSKDTKIAHSKSGEFAKWKRDHQFEEVQTEQMATSRHTPTEIRQHELKKRVHKHDEIGAVKAEAWDQPDYNQSIKARQAEADKKAKEQSKEGVKKLLNKYYTHNKKEHHVEEVDLKESVKIVDRDSDLDQQHFKLHVNGKPEHFVHHNYENSHAKDSKDEIHYQVKRQLKHLSPADQKKVTNVIHSSYRVKEEVELDEGKMGDLAGEIGRHLDKHIDDYKAHGGAEHLGYKTIDTAKKIVKSHNLHPTHAQKFVNDYVEKRLSEEQIDEIIVKQGVYPPIKLTNWKKIYQQQDALVAKLKQDKEKRDQQKKESSDMCPVCGQTPCNCTHIFEQDKFGVKTPSLEQIAKKHNVSMEELKKAHEEGIKVEIEHTKDKELASEIARDHLNEKPDYYKKLKKYVEQFDSMVEDVFQDSQAATQTSFDGANSPDDTVQNRKRQLSKSARMVKALYKKHKMSEDIYDAEKEDKSVATYGKKPKFTKNDDDAGEQAVAVMSGGKTLTGEPRDDVEIDPMMKTRPNGAEDEPKDKKKSKQ